MQVKKKPNRYEMDLEEFGGNSKYLAVAAIALKGSSSMKCHHAT